MRAIITVGLLLLIATAFPIQNGDLYIYDNYRNTSHQLKQREFHQGQETVYSIVIHENSDFRTYYGFPGNGTADNPYMIENLNITGAHFTWISISNTDAHFVIRNCTLEGEGVRWTGHGITIDLWPATSYGIFFSNVTNGKIQDCNISSISRGIGIEDSNDCVLENTDILDTGYAIGFLKSNSCIVTDNNINSSKIGMQFIRSFENLIENNHVTNTRGVTIEDSGENKFFENSISQGFSFSFDEGYLHNNISDNMLDGREILYLYSQQDSTFDCDNYGQVILAECNNLYVTNGQITEVRYAVILLHSSNCSVSGFQVEDSYTGVRIQDSDNVKVENCTIHSSSKGVYVSNSDGIIVRDCNIITSGWLADGIFVYISAGVTITSCSVIQENSLLLSMSLQNTKHYIISEIDGGYSESFKPKWSPVPDYNAGIRLYHVDEFLIAENVISHYRVGINISNSSNGIISLNTINNAGYAIYHIEDNSHGVLVIDIIQIGILGSITTLVILLIIWIRKRR